MSLLSRIVGWLTRDDDIVMDFFAGSGTTGHAVYAVNAADGGHRKFILVQLDERISGEAHTSVATITRRRLSNAGSAYVRSSLDTGFRSLRVATTSMTDVSRGSEETDQLALDELEPSIKSDRTSEDVLFQVLLDWGLELTMPIANEVIAEHQVFDVENGALIACFDKSLDSDIVHEIASRKPVRAVFRDDGFESDSQRINVEQIFREVSPATEVKAI